MDRQRLRLTSHFMFREREIARILATLADGHSILLVGIRRIGKSELMKAALDPLPARVFLDVQDCTDLHDFYSALLAAMPVPLLKATIEVLASAGSVPGRLVDWLRDSLGEISILDAITIKPRSPDDALPRYWKPVAAALLEVLQEHREVDRLPVIGIDELPFMLENLLNRNVPVRDITDALATLRKLRDAGLRMVIGGSISMENLLTLHGISHTVLGGLRREHVPPFTQEEARAYLNKRLEDRPARAAVETALAQIPDYIPSFLDECARHLHPLSHAKEADTALQQGALPAIRRSFVRQFEERLGKNYDRSEAKLAEEMLDRIARHDASGGPLEAGTLPPEHRPVLTKLQYDMFIDEGSGFSYRFTLNILRRWWRDTRGIR